MKTMEDKSYNVSKEQNFKFAASLIKIIAFAIAIMVLVVSRYAFIFFSAAMLPTILAIFFDRNIHKCASATICTFNLIGVLPYLIRLWNSNSINSMAKSVIVDVDSWMVIYGAAFVGQLLYMSLPLLIVKLYAAKVQVQTTGIEKQYLQISEEWGIPIDKK
jgi:hypothetical protein